MITRLLTSAGPLINQSLSAAIAIIAGSFFLYMLFRDIGNRVARISSALLGFVLVTYLGDIGVSYSYDLTAAESWLRLQWLGIAFVPTTYVHLSHAILTMTGLPSRGRRTWTVRILYALSLIFLAGVWWTDLIVRDPLAEPAPHFQPGPAFMVFVAYFVGSVALSLWFIVRARRRTLTQATRHRLTSLLGVYLAPALAAFPFLLISGRSLDSPLVFYGLLIAADSLLAVMLSYMAYSLAFLGTLYPERLIKAQMLQFFMRGPVVAIATLAVIVWVPRTGAVLGLPGDQLTALLAVILILSLQWLITLVRPYIERWLIYAGNHVEVRRIQELEQRLLTGADFRQLLDTLLAVLCEALRVETAFVASLTGESPRLERAIGLSSEQDQQLADVQGLASMTNGQMPGPDDLLDVGGLLRWEDFLLLPLYFQSEEETPRLVGLLGFSMSADGLDPERHDMLMALATRAAEVLEDRRLQGEVMAAIEGLLPAIAAVQNMHGAAHHGSSLEALTTPSEQILSSPDFKDRIKDALSHYWGGPNLTDSVLMRLKVVRQALDQHDGNPQRAMRAILKEAIENLRPEGTRSMTTAEWILYNILEMRFVQGRKVRDVALRLAMSEADFYRKQRIAIEAVAEVVAEMERRADLEMAPDPPPDD